MGRSPSARGQSYSRHSLGGKGFRHTWPLYNSPTRTPITFTSYPVANLRVPALPYHPSIHPSLLVSPHIHPSTHPSSLPKKHESNPLFHPSWGPHQVLDISSLFVPYLVTRLGSPLITHPHGFHRTFADPSSGVLFLICLMTRGLPTSSTLNKN